jgi:hypothetical protein
MREQVVVIGEHGTQRRTMIVIAGQQPDRHRQGLQEIAQEAVLDSLPKSTRSPVTMTMSGSCGAASRVSMAVRNAPAVSTRRYDSLPPALIWRSVSCATR